MNIVIFIGAVFLQAVAGYGQSQGGGSYSYSDSSGNRYGGVYGLKDGKVVSQQGNFPPNFQPPNFEEPNFQDLDYLGDFFPEYFKNLENILQDAGYPYIPPTPFLPSTPFMPRWPRPTFAMPSPTPFGPNRHYGAYSPYDAYDYHDGYHRGYNSYNPSFGANPVYGAPTFLPNNFKRAFKTSIANQKLAFDAARKAFDVTSNQQGFHGGNHGNTAFHDFDTPNFNRYPGFAGFDDAFRGANAQSAYASAHIGPSGFKEQVAAINPENPSNPNIKVTRLNDPSSKGFKSVSVTSFSSSADINGQKTNTRKASTIINDNGKISRYDVSN